MRLAALATAATLAAGLLTLAPPAAAHGTDDHWRTVTAFKKARTQLCLDPERDGRVQVFFRHRAQNAVKATRATVTVARSAKVIEVGRTGWVAPGENTRIDGGTELGPRQVKRWRAYVEIELRNRATKLDSVSVRRLPTC